jgi:hypothetical protein
VYAEACALDQLPVLGPSTFGQLHGCHASRGGLQKRSCRGKGRY